MRLEGDDACGLGLGASQSIKKIRQKGPCVLCGTQRSTSWRKHYLVQGTICNKCYCRTARLVKNSGGGGGASAEGAAPRVPPPAAPPVLRPRVQPAQPLADDVTSHSHSFNRSHGYSQGQGQPRSRSLGSLLAAVPQEPAAARRGEERYGAAPPPAYPHPHLATTYSLGPSLGADGRYAAGPPMTIAQTVASVVPPQPQPQRLTGLESLLDAILQASKPRPAFLHAALRGRGTAAASDSAVHVPPPAAPPRPPSPRPPQPAEQLLASNLLVPLLSEALGVHGDAEAQQHLATLLAAALAPGAPAASAAPAAWELPAAVVKPPAPAPQPQAQPQAQSASPRPQAQPAASSLQPRAQPAQAEGVPQRASAARGHGSEEGPLADLPRSQPAGFTPLHLQTPDWLRAGRAWPSPVAASKAAPSDAEAGSWGGAAGAALAGRLLALQEECWAGAGDPSEAACAASLAWHRCQLQLPCKQQQPLAALPRLGLVLGNGGGTSAPVVHPAGALLLRVLLPEASEQAATGGQPAADGGQPPQPERLCSGATPGPQLPAVVKGEGVEGGEVLAVRLVVYGTAGVLLELWDGRSADAAARLGGHSHLGRPFWDSGDGWGLAFPPPSSPGVSSSELSLFQAVLTAPPSRLAAVPCCAPTTPQSHAAPPLEPGPFSRSLRQAQLALCAAPGAAWPQAEGPGEQAGAKQESAPLQGPLQPPGGTLPAQFSLKQQQQQQHSWQQPKQLEDGMVIDVQVQQAAPPSQPAGPSPTSGHTTQPAAAAPAAARHPASAPPAGGTDPAIGLLLAALQSMPAAAGGLGLSQQQSFAGLADSLGALLGGAAGGAHALQALQPSQHG